ncbi:hypothetical protein K523DRAFT_806 [Schizophyllum commune Tattone D]|nr:hypothetical protein K523DRAFT_806 [Schizophyllum commune Tattone D]
MHAERSSRPHIHASCHSIGSRIIHPHFALASHIPLHWRSSPFVCRRAPYIPHRASVYPHVHSYIHTVHRISSCIGPSHAYTVTLPSSRLPLLILRQMYIRVTWDGDPDAGPRIFVQ